MLFLACIDYIHSMLLLFVKPKLSSFSIQMNPPYSGKEGNSIPKSQLVSSLKAMKMISKG